MGRTGIRAAAAEPRTPLVTAVLVSKGTAARLALRKRRRSGAGGALRAVSRPRTQS